MAVTNWYNRELILNRSWLVSWYHRGDQEDVIYLWQRQVSWAQRKVGIGSWYWSIIWTNNGIYRFQCVLEDFSQLIRIYLIATSTWRGPRFCLCMLHWGWWRALRIVWRKEVPHQPWKVWWFLAGINLKYKQRESFQYYFIIVCCTSHA